MSDFNLRTHLRRQRKFSEKTWGPGLRTGMCVDHIRKELLEIEADPENLEEWIDLILLSCDGALRTGATPEEIIETLVAKLEKNEGRDWPDWRTQAPDKAIEHIGGEEKE